VAAAKVAAVAREPANAFSGAVKVTVVAAV
jgi:hypothetical protein